MELQTQIFTIWLPLLVIVVFTLLGAIRGAVREGIVAASIALGSLLNLQWGDRWGEGLAALPFGWDRNTAQFWTSIAVLWLVVLVIGYGLGSYLGRNRLTATLRLGGAFIGLLSGAAMAGQSLRYGFQYLDNAQPTSALMTDIFSQGLMIWAAWYPIILALGGALLVLVAPLRRAQSAVSRPSEATDWVPATGPAVPYAPSPLPAAPSYMSPPAPATGVGDAGRDANFTPSSAQTIVMPEVDAPPTTLLPRSDAANSNRIERDSLIWAGPSAGAETRSFATVTPPVEPGPDNAADEASAVGSGASSAPSWLLEPVHPKTEEIRSTDNGQTFAPASSAGVAENATGSEATSATPALDDTRPQDMPQRCRNCGSPLLPGAAFCTECGTRLT